MGEHTDGGAEGILAARFEHNGEVACDFKSFLEAIMLQLCGSSSSSKTQGPGTLSHQALGSPRHGFIPSALHPQERRKMHSCTMMSRLVGRPDSEARVTTATMTQRSLLARCRRQLAKEARRCHC
mmetsp:Transcript_30795/g.66284  ORF Transcript_30795/g.66284 Transcript_30795/m.66284 type:complete len:125 (+) Transcript_30795:61-435(+)